MGKRMHKKGFTLIEMCLVIVLMSILFTISIKHSINTSYPYYQFPSKYLRVQSEAILEANHKELIDEYAISFNENGNVKKAQTLHFPQGDIVVELGGGRLVYK